MDKKSSLATLHNLTNECGHYFKSLFLNSVQNIFQARVN